MNENNQENTTISEESLQSSSDSSEVVTNDNSVESVPNDNSEQANTEQIFPSNEESSTSSESSSCNESNSSDTENNSDESTDSDETNLEESTEEPTSTVIQVERTEDGDLDITELDVNSLNIMSESYVESMLALTPTSNDYYTFIDSSIEDYFSGIMANYPLNEYKAYHLRHYVYNTQYSSYYDDYYYLFYDYPNNSCLELYKSYNSNSYTATWGTAEILDSTISYGSEVGWSDLREGVNYVSWLSALGVLACVCVLYIVHAIFRHLHS